MYYFYFGDVLLPVAPSSMSVKINNKNKTLTLANGGEINILKQTGLSEISFDLLIPSVRYPFAEYPGGFRNANYYLDVLEILKKNCKPFPFKVIRMLTAAAVLRYSAGLGGLTPGQLAASDMDGDGRITAKDARIILLNEQTGQTAFIDDTTMNVSLEEYSLKEDAEKLGMDFSVSVKLKQFNDFAVKTLVFSS